jgi:hypothetical protein
MVELAITERPTLVRTVVVEYADPGFRSGNAESPAGNYNGGHPAFLQIARIDLVPGNLIGVGHHPASQQLPKT